MVEIVEIRIDGLRGGYLRDPMDELSFSFSRGGRKKERERKEEGGIWIWALNAKRGTPAQSEGQWKTTGTTACSCDL